MSRIITPHRWQGWLSMLAAFCGAFLLAFIVDRLGHWPEPVANLSGRAILGAEGKADPSTLLAAYPPLPYGLTAISAFVTTPFGLNPLVLLAAVLAALFAGLYAAALRRAGYAPAAILGFVLLIAMNPVTLHAVASGPQAMLLLLGIWMLGHGMFGFRANGSVNDLIILVLALPLLMATSVEGAVLAAAAIPFLLLAVPRQLVQGAHGSVYVVLLFPLGFAMLAIGFVGWILLHDPLAPFSSVDLQAIARTPTLPQSAAGIAAAACGMLAVLAGLMVRGRGRRSLKGPAAALFGALLLGAGLLLIGGLAADPLEALAPMVAGAAVATVRWPVEPGRFVRSFGLAAVSLLTAISVVIATPAHRNSALAQALRGQPSTAPAAADVALGRFLAARKDVMFDAIAHPAVVAARGNAAGLATAYTPAFQVDLLRREIRSDHVVAARHRPGVSDDALGRVYHDLYARGRPGYRLAYDKDGWRVWSRAKERMARK